MKLHPDAARDVQTVIRRLVLRQPELTSKEIHEIITKAGLQASPGTVSITRSDLRQVIQLLKQEQLLIDDFERERQSIASDFLDTRTNSAPKNAARGRT